MTLRQATTTILFSAATLLAPSALSAQFTTFVAPPQKQPVATPAKPTVASAKTKADSVHRMTLTDMKAWVDSAAGTSTQVAVTDTIINASNPVPSLPPAPMPERRTTSFSNGAVAPSTASALPTYLVGGVAIFAAGLLLLRRRQES
ncbi:MAG TPA: hypothetical protein VGJ18_09615 [Gemmatimonadaceae bacterium]